MYSCLITIQTFLEFKINFELQSFCENNKSMSTHFTFIKSNKNRKLTKIGMFNFF